MRRLGLGIAIAALAAAASSLLVPESDSARTARPAFSFSVSPPGPPAAIAGEKYAGFSFCKPPPPGAVQCGAAYRTKNPRGGFPPYTFSLRNVVPGLHVNLRSGLLFGTVPKGAQKREWPFTVCATESRTPKYQQPRTRCDETSITIKGAAAQVTIKSYVVTMQAEARKWRTVLVSYVSCEAFKASGARAASEFAGFAAHVATIPAVSDLKAAHDRLAQALTALSEFWRLASSPPCRPGDIVPDFDTGAGERLAVLAKALMLEWADAVVAAARAAGIAVDRASLLCCGAGG